MEKKILIVDDSGLGKREIARHMKDNDAVIVVENQIQDNSFDIDGVRYAPIEQQKSGLSKKMMGILAVASMFAPVAGYGLSNKVRILPRGTDIIEEFKLIQEKKSNLGKWERDEVVRIFERNFKIRI